MDKSSKTVSPRAAAGSRVKSSQRRMVDSVGIAIFHAAVLGLFAWADPKHAVIWIFLAVAAVVADISYALRPIKHSRPVLEPVPDAETPPLPAQIRPFALELLVLLAPPAFLISWFLFDIWKHQALTLYQLIAVLVAVPLDVWFASWFIKMRTARHAGIKNDINKFIAYFMIATWAGSIFLFVLLLVSLLTKLFLS